MLTFPLNLLSNPNQPLFVGNVLQMYEKYCKIHTNNRFDPGKLYQVEEDFLCSGSN